MPQSLNAVYRTAENILEPETSTLKSGAEAAASSTDARVPRRMFVGLLLFVTLAVVGILVAAQVLFVNRIPALTEARLDQAERRWGQAGLASYDMDLDIRGAQPGSVHIEVRNFEVTKMTRDGRAPQRRTWDVWSVPGQFETLERELELAEDPVHEMQARQGTQLQLRADFDPKYGFPRQYHRYVSGGGPEVYWSVTTFTAK